jgi:hypothetical protein
MIRCSREGEALSAHFLDSENKEKIAGNSHCLNQPVTFPELIAYLQVFYSDVR